MISYGRWLCRNAVHWCMLWHRDIWIMSAAVQHNAVRLLWLQRRLQLCQSQRQVVLAVNNCCAADDARDRQRHHAVHQPLYRLRRPSKHHSCSQSDHWRTTLSTRLAWSLDRLQLCHGSSSRNCFLALSPFVCASVIYAVCCRYFPGLPVAR